MEIRDALMSMYGIVETKPEKPRRPSSLFNQQQNAFIHLLGHMPLSDLHDWSAETGCRDSIDQTIVELSKRFSCD